MPQPFKGVINVDIRDSVPDWDPFQAPKAPEGAPSVVFIVLDDVGFSALSSYGGPIEDAEHRQDRRRGRALHAVPHDRPLLAYSLLPPDGAQSHAQQHGVHHRMRGRLPEREWRDPAGEWADPGDLGAQGWNTYMVGKWHLCPESEMNLASSRRNWPTGRGFDRFYGFLGAETNQWYPDLVFEQQVVATAGVPTGDGLILSAAFDKDGEEPPGVATGTLSLYYGDQKLGEGRIKTQPGKFSIAGEGLTIGRDSSEPVTDDYPGRHPYPLTGGTINRVAVDVSGEPYVDLEREAVAMMARE